MEPKQILQLKSGTSSEPSTSIFRVSSLQYEFQGVLKTTPAPPKKVPAVPPRFSRAMSFPKVINPTYKGYLEDHPRTCKWLRTMVHKSFKDQVGPIINGQNHGL